MKSIKEFNWGYECNHGHYRSSEHRAYLVAESQGPDCGAVIVPRQYNKRERRGQNC